MMITITTENLETEVMKADKPVLVDFVAPWCGYCRRIEPIVNLLEKEYEDKLRIGKINIDDEPELAEKFDVMTIPTLLLFQTGEAGKPLIAAGSRSQIDAWLKEQGIDV